MRIKGVEGMTPHELQHELTRGGKFVIYLYTVSVLVMTFRRGSDVHFVRAGESAVGKGMAYTGSISTNLGGGKDVTAEVVAALTGA